MFWPDRLAQEIEEKYGKGPILIRDEKTVSGRVHIGSMRGVAIHGAIHETLNARGVENSFRYELNDFDPMDDIPTYLDQALYKPHLGKPLRDIPAPAGSNAANFAEHFGNEFREVIEAAGWHPEFYWGSSLYLTGQMDGCIRDAIEHAQDIARIYKEVSGSQREEKWLPVNVICPTCGKVTTTEASDFDGETVQVHCRVDKVAYTAGCGFEGRVSPFGGKAKLPWKVEWPAKWRVNGVLVEGAGKDHSTKGGSRDVANHIARDVFNYEPPFDVPYEFILIGGRKMSSSKGHGSSAKEIADLVPAKILRLALLGKDYNQQVNFDPEGDTIPVLYDQYDKFAESYGAGVRDDYARLFEMIHSEGEVRKAEFRMRFSQVAFVVQMPHMDLVKEATTLKGVPLTTEDTLELEERAAYAKQWLGEYAPEKYVFKLHDELPEVTKQFTPEQKKVLADMADFVEQESPDAEALHTKLHELKAFKEIYRAFLGKESGPKAGWFLASLDRDFVLKRLREASL